MGINVNLLWAKIYDVIIKSFLCVEGTLFSAYKKINQQGKGQSCSCFQLFGYDIMLDSDLNPWILEVNLSPSFATDSPLDFEIKANLITDTLNLVGVRKNQPKSQKKMKMQKIVRQNTLSNNENSHSPSKRLKKALSPDKKTALLTFDEVEVALLEKISKISAKHRSMVFESVSEIERNVKLNFTRIFPAAGTDYYDKYFDGERPFNKLIYKYLCQKTELSQLTESSKLNDLSSLKFHFKIEIPKAGIGMSDMSNCTSVNKLTSTENSPKAKKNPHPFNKSMAGVKLERI